MTRPPRYGPINRHRSAARVTVGARVVKFNSLTWVPALTPSPSPDARERGDEPDGYDRIVDFFVGAARRGRPAPNAYHDEFGGPFRFRCIAAGNRAATAGRPYKTHDIRRLPLRHKPVHARTPATGRRGR